jgi:hypothetical protein
MPRASKQQTEIRALVSPSSLLGFNEDLSKNAVGFRGLPEGA